MAGAPALSPRSRVTQPTTIIGALVAIAGLALEILAARALARAATSARPFAAPDALVTAGVFSLSRNPFYCGIIVLLAGIAVALSLDWALLTLPLFWLALDRRVVPDEERRLEEAFGDTYRAYAARTPRWIG